MGKEEIIRGMPISQGIAIGKAFFFHRNDDVFPKTSISENDVDKEIFRYRLAIKKSRLDLLCLQKSYENEGSNIIVDILNTHLEMLNDPLITEEVEKKIRKNKENTEAVFDSIITEYKKKFKDDGFFSERVKDIVDISKRVLKHLYPFKKRSFSDIPFQSVVVAYEIIPSDTFEACSDNIFAFVTQTGGHASHAAIIARAKGIPYVAKIDVRKLSSKTINSIIVDGCNGDVIINPTKETLNKYLNLQEELKKYYDKLKINVVLPAMTVDKREIYIYGNIEQVKDVDDLFAAKVPGIGLFRSEYLFFTEKKFPNEEQQFAVYKQLAQRMEKSPVVIRLFDIGNDKNYTFSYWEKDLDVHYHEINPVLGCRALRYLLKNIEILKCQLRAILRASSFGNLRILLPLVTDISELIEVKFYLKQCMEELREENKPFAQDIPIGCMIEVPAAAIQCEHFAKQADFLCVGTNDLTQYVLAIDRSNLYISHLYSSIHPSVLTLIDGIIKAGKKYQKQIIFCGEMAADPINIRLLIGLGAVEISLSPRHIPLSKEIIRQINYKDVALIAKKALKKKTVEEVKSLIQKEKGREPILSS